MSTTIVFIVVERLVGMIFNSRKINRHAINLLCQMEATFLLLPPVFNLYVTSFFVFNTSAKRENEIKDRRFLLT